MKANYLLLHKYKKIGWLLFFPSMVLGFVSMHTTNASPFYIKVVSLLPSSSEGPAPWVKVTSNMVLDEIAAIFIIASCLMIAFSKEKQEDEMIAKIRLESLVWAVYVNYGILVLSFLLLYDLTFWWIMIYNMFTIPIIFIIRYEWQLHRLRKTTPTQEADY